MTQEDVNAVRGSEGPLTCVIRRIISPIWTDCCAATSIALRQDLAGVRTPGITEAAVKYHDFSLSFR